MGGGALDPAQGIEAGGFMLEPLQGALQRLRACEQGLAPVGALGLEAMEQAQLGERLVAHEVVGPAALPFAVEDVSGLGQSDGGVIVAGAEQETHAPAVAGREQQDRDARFGEAGKYPALQRDAALDDDPLEQAQGQGDRCGIRTPDAQDLAIES